MSQHCLFIDKYSLSSGKDYHSTVIGYSILCMQILFCLIFMLLIYLYLNGLFLSGFFFLSITKKTVLKSPQMMMS